MPLYALQDMVPEVVPGAYWVAPTASVIGRVRLARDVSVWWGAVLRGDMDLIDIGEGTNIQDGAILHTDAGVPLVLGAHVTVGHRAMLHGCSVGEGSLIGIGATVLNGARIGRHCLVGAHALVTEGTEIPDGSLVLGAPAKVVRPVNEKQLMVLQGSGPHYVHNAERYRKGLRPVGD
ncbi:gamma carbonic anhydrase family protein [Aggregicoccus sp. 17bor-14]|uniref:gamma carbonic anhydrase family protein n=1 Tax=Myxococcaceae TaxID=31 RepID=UPI00129C71DE|nr:MULTISPECIES: gamma carbonic anhydrase family protein [Myxococcaceae]MBF5044572.1 gamma carbonic anhydrase family protein [Simulacricoccus sp. 17bor-14]MRI90317.1 gamma carbonic anhydrase family protein [Aggregicoccus sp. 17bor-14]